MRSYTGSVAAVSSAAPANLPHVHPHSATAVCAIEAVAGSAAAGLEETGMASDHRFGELRKGVGAGWLGGVLG